jgi:hypothetical protein
MRRAAALAATRRGSNTYDQVHMQERQQWEQPKRVVMSM